MMKSDVLEDVVLGDPDLERGATGDEASMAPLETSQDDAKTNSNAPPLEPYLELTEIAKMHPDSKICLENVEKSGGLTAQHAADRLLQHGKNILTPPPKTPEWKRFLQQFQNTFLLLLLGSAGLSLIAYFLDHDITNLYLALVLFIVVVLTGFVQFHEGKAYQILDSFTSMLAVNGTVIRQGKQTTVPIQDLVPGDLAVIKNGDKVPADMVLLLCRGLKAEASSLTGESEPISCSAAVSAPGTAIFECKNMVFNSSLCFDGMAIGLVLRTGDRTAIGAIAKLASGTGTQTSTLQKEVARFVRLIAIVAVSMAVVCFVASIFVQGARSVNEIIKLFVSGFLVIIVANVPQGLPSTVISLLSLAARSMAQRAVLVKRLDCVETLGCCSIVCSDKTGTLTKNQMTVTDIWYNKRLVRRHRWEVKSMEGNEPQALLYRAAILCNRSEPVSEEQDNEMAEKIRESQRRRISNVSRLTWGSSVQKSILKLEELPVQKFSGNPSDAALLTYCDKIYSVKQLRDDYPILFEVPFNSTNKWQLVIVKSKDFSKNATSVKYEVLMKGAPEVILGRCSTFSSMADPLTFEKLITDKFREDFMAQYESFASQGRRVLALCSRTFSAPQDIEFSSDDNEFNFPTTELNFVGLVAIMDPPRENVPDAIAKCHRAGIKVFMVTGDHPLTARAIAKDVGLLQGDNNIELLENETSKADWNTCDGAIIHGSRIDALSDDQWRTILSKNGVCFARTTPLHKLIIVQKCQTLMRHVVAVTGDGVNDALALKVADVGVAMGLNGSAVAQESADILLMDDNFASIVAAIEEGRIIFDNIKKTVAYTMAHIMPEVVSAIVNLLGGLPAGLTAMQVLTIDLGTELGPAISLAYEKPESNIMDRKPRDLRKDRLVSPVLLLYSYVTSGAIITMGCLLAYMFTYRQSGIHISDFHRPGLDAPGGDFFSLTSSDPVTVERTGETFSAKEQRKIFSEGVTAFYITLTVAQFCHIWVCKTRLNSLFVHGLFSNKLTFYGVSVGLAMVVFFSYIPGVSNFVGSAVVGWIPWVSAFATGALLWLYNEASKWYFRHAKPGSVFVRMFAW